MIPKVIHYCWFGGKELPEPVKNCISSWKKYCPDYEIVEWNESNYDIASAPLYVRQAYEAKKWAFVPDYIRAQIVYEHGGIYLDTDVEIIRPFDSLLSNRTYFGFEDAGRVNLGHGFGSENGAGILQEIMAFYQERPFLGNDGNPDLTPSPVLNTATLMKHGLILNGKEQVLDGEIHIYPADFFCPKNFKSGAVTCTENTYSIHHFDASWYNPLKKLLLKKSRKYINKYGEAAGIEKMQRWKKRHRVLDVLAEEGPKGLAKKVKKKIRKFLA